MTVFMLPCSTLQTFMLVICGTLLLNFLGYFDDAELKKNYTVLRGPGIVLVWVGRMCHFFFAGYSKFTAPGKERPLGSLPAVPGFLIIYSGGLGISCYLCLALFKEDLTLLVSGGMSLLDVSTPALLSACSLVHYLKRCAEVVFVHFYTESSRVETVCAVSICGWYTANVIVTIWLSRPEFACGGPPASTALRVIGLSFWVIGEISNAYHHLLLRWLRTGGPCGNADPSSAADEAATQPMLKSKYKVPHGGLFGLVATPHYFCEIINWLGVALMAGHSVVWVMHGCNLTYLAGRAVLTSRYYREKIDGYPVERKHMIPFLF